MEHVLIDTAGASPVMAMRSLFDVCRDTRSMIGSRPTTRQAYDDEILAYAEWLALKAGLVPLQESSLIGGSYSSRNGREPIRAVTYGKRTGKDEYENGSFSIPMPGRNAHRDSVTMETLDEAGEVVSSSTLPTEPKKGGVIWDKDAVRKACGVVGRGKCPPIPVREPVDDPLEAIGANSEGDPLFERPDGLRYRLRGGEAYARDEELMPPPSGDPLDRTSPFLTAAEHERKASQRSQDSAPTMSGHPEPISCASGPEIEPVPHVEADAPLSIVEMTPEPDLVARVAALESMLQALISQREAPAPVSVESEREKELLEMMKRHRSARSDADDRAKAAERDLRDITRRADEMEKEALRLSDLLRARDAELAAFKRLMPDSNTPARPADLAKLIDERDEARRKLASAEEKAQQGTHVHTMVAEALEEMTGRALRAETALRAREAMSKPYLVAAQAVTFAPPIAA